MKIFLSLIVLLCSVLAFIDHKAVHKVSPTEDLMSLVDWNSVIFVEFQDKQKQKQYKEYSKAFVECATWFRRKFHTYGPTSWLTVDYREYPELLESMRIGVRDNIDGGNMINRSYIYVLVTGDPAVIEFDWDSTLTYEENKEIMAQAIIDQILWPVKKLDSCDDIKELADFQKNEDPHFRFLVYFSYDPLDIRDGGFLAARMEFMRMREDRVHFYELSGTKATNCIRQYAKMPDTSTIEEEKNVLMLYPGFGHERTVRSSKLFLDQSEIISWIHCSIVNKEKRFDRRAVDAMWHHNLSALVYLREGGHPSDDAPERERSDLDQNAIDEFELLIDVIAAKQDKAVFFYADPRYDKPVMEQTILEFMNFPAFKDVHGIPDIFLPNFMIAINHQSRIEFFGMEQEMSGVTADLLAQWMHIHIFGELDTSNLNPEYLVKVTADPVEFHNSYLLKQPDL